MSLKGLLEELEVKTIAKKIGIPHDETRVRYPLESNTVQDFDEFTNAITYYYNWHYTACVSNGRKLSQTEAANRAKEILEQEYRRRGGDIVMAYNDAHEGTNGGMRTVLDTIAEGIKAKSVEHYIKDVFERYVAPNSWEEKVEIIRQFISHISSSRQ